MRTGQHLALLALLHAQGGEPPEPAADAADRRAVSADPVVWGAADGPLVSLIRVTPNYPGRAELDGLEGYAIVQFDVLADGSVANVSVVESSDRVFERPAIEAAKRFRFKPRVAEGVPQMTTGLRNLFRFEMNNQ